MLTEIPEIVSSQPSVMARASMGVASTGNRSGTRNLQQELKFIDYRTPSAGLRQGMFQEPDLLGFHLHHAESQRAAAFQTYLSFAPD